VAKLLDLLTDSKRSGVYRLEGPAAVNKMKRLVEQRGLAFFALDGKIVHNKDQFLKQAAAALQFPDYFGNNWDAFADCLTDMEWHEADGFVILYGNFDFFAERERDQFGVALEIFTESAEFWRSQGKLMIVLLSGAAENAKGVPSISF
jgi:RNAse (barnase) inhibitor barstar